MFTLLIVIMLNGQMQNFQIDDFTSDETCQSAFNTVSPMLLDYVKQNSDVFYYCIKK
jgi:hypothetical protein